MRKVFCDSLSRTFCCHFENALTFLRNYSQWKCSECDTKNKKQDLFEHVSTHFLDISGAHGSSRDSLSGFGQHFQRHHDKLSKGGRLERLAGKYGFYVYSILFCFFKIEIIKKLEHVMPAMGNNALLLVPTLVSDVFEFTNLLTVRVYVFGEIFEILMVLDV